MQISHIFLLMQVPIYDTFGEKECQFIVKQAEVQAVFVSRENFEKMLRWTLNIPSVKKIIVWGAAATEAASDGADKSSLPLPSSGDMAISYEQCLEKGLEALPALASPPKPQDLAIIMYTSGTT